MRKLAAHLIDQCGEGVSILLQLALQRARTDAKALRDLFHRAAPARQQLVQGAPDLGSDRRLAGPRLQVEEAPGIPGQAGIGQRVDAIQVAAGEHQPVELRTELNVLPEQAPVDLQVGRRRMGEVHAVRLPGRAQDGADQAVQGGNGQFHGLPAGLVPAGLQRHMQHRDLGVLRDQDGDGVAEPVAVALDLRQSVAQRGLVLQQQADRAEV
ncbi:hypothetical protein D3C72_1388150 [compost metagenome]